MCAATGQLLGESMAYRFGDGPCGRQDRLVAPLEGVEAGVERMGSHHGSADLSHLVLSRVREQVDHPVGW